MSFDLPAYLARIGLKDVPAPDADGLATLQRAHRLAIPFESLDVRLGRGIPLDPDRVFDKLVTRRRGGYCFEHNVLFLAALHASGFVARPLLARVWLGAVEVPPRTHALALVTLPDAAGGADGAEWIADAGFGAAYAPPLPLVHGALATSPDGALHALARDAEHGWVLGRTGSAAATDGRGAEHDPAAGGLPQYSFTTETVYPSDLLLANHWTASAPASRFRQHAIVSAVLPTGFASLTDRHYSRSSAADHVTAEIASAKAYRMRLSLVFGIDLTDEEVAGLGLF